ncbi:MAG: DUF5103 domain-containing protein [Gillisia sp.]
MKIFYFLIFLAMGVNAHSQQQPETSPPNYIRSINFKGSTEYSGNPILKAGDYLSLSFDDIIGDEANYYYTLEYFNYDWTPGQLSKSEYLNGFDDVRITQYKNSFNTLQPFTHYELTIPNADTKGLKVSGNYMLKIFNDNKELVFSRKFMVYEPLSQVAVSIKRSRDLKYIDTKQVVNFTIDSPDLLLKDPEKTVKVLVLQNQNLKTAIKNVKPQYTIGSQLIYRYDDKTAFWAGNEYLQFDNKELRASTADISRIEVQELYHHYLFTDRTRDSEPYTYNPDINGQFKIRTLQGKDPDIEAEYVWMHFSLEDYDALQGGEIHIYGAFNNFQIDDSTLMTYNKDSGLFENARLFKQGFYNYKYVLVNPDKSIAPGFVSGNFAKTENDYQVLVYFRDLGARYDRIIGFGSANSTNITN